MSAQIRHEPTENRYTLWVGEDQVGLADYEIVGNRKLITHTEVDPSRRGQGLGQALVKQTLDAIVDESEYKIVPVCPFVATYMDAHPEYAELRSA